MKVQRFSSKELKIGHIFNILPSKQNHQNHQKKVDTLYDVGCMSYVSKTTIEKHILHTYIFLPLTGIAKKVTKFRESWWICLNFLLAALLLLMPRANNYLLESFQDFLIELDMNLVEILIFSKKVPTFLSALLIILVGLMVTLFSEKKSLFPQDA